MYNEIPRATSADGLVALYLKPDDARILADLLLGFGDVNVHGRPPTIDDYDVTVWTHVAVQLKARAVVAGLRAAPASSAQRQNQPKPQPRSTTRLPATGGSIARRLGHSGAPASPSRERRSAL